MKSQIWVMEGEVVMDTMQPAVRVEQTVSAPAMPAMMAQLRHDIRGPLSALKVLAATVRCVSQEQKRLFELSVNRIANLLSLLNEGNDEVKQVEVSEFQAFAQEIIREKELLSGRVIRFERSPNLPRRNFISVNGVRFARVLSNLIDNAIQFSSPLSEIEVRMFATQSRLYVVIEDHGCGMSIERREALASWKCNFKPILKKGLGLCTAADGLQTMQASLKLLSRPGQGCRARLMFPWTRTAVTPAAC